MKIKRLVLMIILLFTLTSCGLLNQDKPITTRDVHKEVLASMTLPDIVYQDMRLPTTDIQGVTLTWVSDKPESLSNEGRVFRGTQDISVVLTLGVTYQKVEKYKPFDIIVAKDDTYFTHQDVFDEIILPKTVSEDINLPTIYRIESITLKWVSNHSAISSEGKVTQGSVDTSVNLVLEVTVNGETNSKIYQVVVLREGLRAPETLGYMKTMNAYELENFSKTGLPSKGTYPVLVIPIEIKEYTFPVNYKTTLDVAFNGSSSETGFESVSSYYTKSSYGHLNLSFDIADKYVTTQTKAYYEARGDNADQTIIAEALKALDDKIDFSKYDSNHDQTIDSVIFIYSVDYDMVNEETAWWAWVYNAGSGTARNLDDLDGKEFEYYMWASYNFIFDEIPGSQVVINAETYIHELGHLLGFPDLYSKTHTYGPLGGWDMMDSNAGDHGPLNKILFGWIKPLVLTKGVYEISLDDYSADNDGIDNVILIPHDHSDLEDGDAFDEFLLIISYSPSDLYEPYLNTNLGLRSSGIVIYHVDARLNNRKVVFWDDYFRQNNDGIESYFVRILEADKNHSLSGENYISESDILKSGSINLQSYSWHQSGVMDIEVSMLSGLLPLFGNDNTILRITVQ